jgi:hypothetical protein
MTDHETRLAQLPMLIGEFGANMRETARIITQNYRGHNLVCLSKWYLHREGKLMPGNKGFVVNVRRLRRLKNLVDLALAKALELDLLPDRDGGKR